MKLFVAVRIEPAVARAIAAFANDLRRMVEQDARARVSWVHESKLHITTRFIGYVDEARLAQIRGALVPPLSVMQFTAGAAGAGVFPPRGSPRVFWAGVTDGLEPLSDIEAEVSHRLSECGVAREERPYHPHITLARVKDAGGLRAAILDECPAPVFGSWRVDAITLFESRQSARGPEYVPIEVTQLRSGT